MIYFGSDRLDNSGDAQQGFWFLQNAIGLSTNKIGGGVRYIGNRPGNTANTLELNDYYLSNLYVSYEVKPGMVVSGRVNNLFDKTYAQWADIFYPTEVMLGQPRYYELGVYVKL